jgi:hypothetical protein
LGDDGMGQLEETITQLLKSPYDTSLPEQNEEQEFLWR